MIQRFSEDIDLTLDVRYLLRDYGTMTPNGMPPSKNQAGKRTKEVRARLPEWITDTMVPTLERAAERDGLTVTIRADGDKVYIDHDPVAVGTGYARPSVMLELGARATGEPDGNGRLGRLLITLLLCDQQVLKEPMLYLSLYFKTHRQDYYELLDRVRSTGDWEAWLHFFAEGVTVTATQAVETAQQLHALSEQHRERIHGLGRAAASALQVHGALMQRPIVTASALAGRTGLSFVTANRALGHLQELGIVAELTGRRRNRLFSYTSYVEAFAQGTESPSR